MYCPNCGKEIPEGYRFCPECGYNVTMGSISTEVYTPQTKTNSFINILSIVMGTMLIIFSILILIGSIMIKFRLQNSISQLFSPYGILANLTSLGIDVNDPTFNYIVNNISNSINNFSNYLILIGFLIFLVLFLMGIYSYILNSINRKVNEIKINLNAKEEKQ